MEALFFGLGGGREGGEEGRVEVERRSARLGFRVRRETKCLSLRSFSLSLSLTAREAPRGRRRQPWRFRPFLSLERRKKDEEAIELVFDAQYSSVRKRVRKRASEFFSLSLPSIHFSLVALFWQSAGFRRLRSLTHRVQLSLSLSRPRPLCSRSNSKRERQKRGESRHKPACSALHFQKKERRENRHVLLHPDPGQEGPAGHHLDRGAPGQEAQAVAGFRGQHRVERR